MMPGSSNDSSSKKQSPIQPVPKSTSSKINSMRIAEQPDLEELTPLQHQRLDAAVMMLVNYLVSVSSGA